MKKIISFCLLLAVCLSLFSCEINREYDEGEVALAAAEIIPKTALLNEIYWGDGIPYVENLNTAVGYYYEASPTFLIENGIETIEDLKEMTRAVFSESYSTNVFDTKLTSVKDGDEIISYAGYYQNKDGDISLWIQVWEGNACGIEVTKKTPYGVCIISENFQLDGITQTINFSDSENNSGQVVLELGNEEIAVTIETTDVSSDVYICDTMVTFLLDEKSDKPVSVQLDAQTLQDMVRGETTLGQLRRQGFELQFNENEKNAIATEYRLKNTDVIFAFSGTDPDTFDPLDDPVVVAISAPAYMIIPDKIGERNDAFEKDHIIYVPDGEIRGDVGTGVMFGFPEETADEYLAELGKIIKRGTIERNTNVCFTGTNPPASGYDWLYEIYIEGLPII